MKLDKDLYIKHAKRLQAIINDKSTFLNFLNRSDFNSVLKTQLNVLFACEKLFPNEKVDDKFKAKELVNVFNKLTNSTFAINEKYTYEDETDLIDQINYLFTFCNNMFKVNLDDLVAGKNITATDPKIDLRAKPDISDEGPRMNPNFAFAAGGIPLAGTPYENPYLIGKAYAKLNDDMKAGKFYRYKTQPKIIPIIKWASVICLMLLALSLILCGVFAFMADPLQVSIESESYKLGGIASGIIYIIVAGFCAYPITMIMKTLVGKTSKNLNLKYHFAWGFIVVTIALAFLNVMLDINKTILLESNAHIDDPSGLAYTGYLGWKAMFIVICSLVGLNIVPIIIGSIYNPKPDPEIVEKKIREYIDLFSSESGQRPVPPKADVQKPTDVKDPNKDKPKS